MKTIKAPKPKAGAIKAPSIVAPGLASKASQGASKVPKPGGSAVGAPGMGALSPAIPGPGTQKNAPGGSSGVSQGPISRIRGAIKQVARPQRPKLP